MLLTDALGYADKKDPTAPGERALNGVRLVRPSEVNPQISPDLDEILVRALEPDENKRYPHAMALLEDLKAWSPPKESSYRILSETTVLEKTALGPVKTAAPLDQSKQQIEEAIKLAADFQTLPEAADLLEEALKDCPELRNDRHLYLLQLWRKGVQR